MRIAVFIKSTTFHKNFGGLETHNKVLCQGLAGKGFDVTVFSPKRDVKMDSGEENGVKYVFIPSIYKMIVLPWQHSVSWFSKSVDVFQSVHKDKPFDLVISQSSAGEGVIRYKKELGIKTIAISHGTTLGEFKTRLYDSSSLKDYFRLIKDTGYVLINYFGRQRNFILGSDKVIAVSQAVKKAIVEETFVPEEKVAVIYNGVDPAKFNLTVAKQEEGKVKFIYIGRIVRSKGLFDLIKVFKEVNPEKASLELVGDGADFDELKGLVAGLTLEKNVTFSGKLSYDEVIKKYLAADVFVLPTLRVEGFPMTLPEAMLAGLPVIASNLGGISDAIKDGETGFLVPPGDHKILKEKIELLTEDAILRNSLGERARQKALNDFTLEKMLDSYITTIRDVLRE